MYCRVVESPTFLNCNALRMIRVKNHLTKICDMMRTLQCRYSPRHCQIHSETSAKEHGGRWPPASGARGRRAQYPKGPQLITEATHARYMGATQKADVFGIAASEMRTAAPSGGPRAGQPATGRSRGLSGCPGSDRGLRGRAGFCPWKSVQNSVDMVPHRDVCRCVEWCMPPKIIVYFGQKLLKGFPGDCRDNPKSIWMLLHVNISVETSHVMWS